MSSLQKARNSCDQLRALGLATEELGQKLQKVADGLTESLDELESDAWSRGFTEAKKTIKAKPER